MHIPQYSTPTAVTLKALDRKPEADVGPTPRTSSTSIQTQDLDANIKRRGFRLVGWTDIRSPYRMQTVSVFIPDRKTGTGKVRL